MSFALPASMGLTDILSLAIAAILVNNYILVQFLGCCSFFGVSKKTDTALGIFLPLITTNCAVLGAAKTNISNGYSFIGSLVYGVAAGVGYTLAIVLFASIRERLDATSKCPKCFEGFPISLVAAALLAMSFMGFSGLSIW